MDQRDAIDQQESLRSIQRAATALIGRLKALGAVRPGTGQGLRDLETALEKLGDPEALVAALRDTVSQGQDLVADARARRAESLRQAVAGFVRSVDGERSVREVASGWRIGHIELEVQPQEARIRSLYNHETVVPWTPISDAEDVAKVHASAEQHLATAAIADDRLVRVVNEAYDSVLGRSGRPAPHHLRLEDVLTEMRVVIVRDALMAHKPKDAEVAVRLPAWALLHAFDRFRAVSASLPAGQRLLVEAGTVREGEKFGVTLNGLDPHRDYQRFCYVQRVSEG